MRFDFNIDGEEQIMNALAQLVPRLEKKVVRQALRKGAKPILDKAKAKVASIRVTGINTDPLRKGLKIRALRRSRRGFGVAVQTPTRDELGIPPGSKWYYPAHIELGTKNAPAKPYLRQSLEESRQETLAIIRREMLAGVDREVRRG